MHRIGDAFCRGSVIVRGPRRKAGVFFCPAPPDQRGKEPRKEQTSPVKRQAAAGTMRPATRRGLRKRKRGDTPQIPRRGATGKRNRQPRKPDGPCRPPLIVQGLRRRYRTSRTRILPPQRPSHPQRLALRLRRPLDFRPATGNRIRTARILKKERETICQTRKTKTWTYSPS